MEKIEFVPTTSNNMIALIPTQENYTELKTTTSREEASTPTTPNYYPIQKKKNIDPIFHLYLGSMSVVGLFILFRMIQKS